jgi:hypothetical protein
LFSPPVFIFNNRLTGATQYTDIVYVPEMAAKKEEIKKFIQQYWDKVKGNIKEERGREERGGNGRRENRGRNILTIKKRKYKM